MSEKDFLCALSDLLDEKLEEKLDKILDEKLEEKLDKILDEKFDEKLKPINERLKRVEMTLDHNVVPRLQNIEECYITTYKRYQKSVDDYEGMKQDIDVLKKVVESHSEKLQKIS